MASIRPVNLSDVPTITDIYNHYIRTSVITFELEEIDASEMQKRIKEILNVEKHHWLVIESESKVVGYAYNHRWRARKAYDHTTEVSIYLDSKAKGQGFGTKLYNHLIQQLKQDGFHALIAGVALPNEASVRLHEKLGFEKVAHYKEVGYKFDTWVDVGYWQLIYP